MYYVLTFSWIGLFLEMNKEQNRPSIEFILGSWFCCCWFDGFSLKFLVPCPWDPTVAMVKFFTQIFCAQECHSFWHLETEHLMKIDPNKAKAYKSNNGLSIYSKYFSQHSFGINCAPFWQWNCVLKCCFSKMALQLFILLKILISSKSNRSNCFSFYVQSTTSNF